MLLNVAPPFVLTCHCTVGAGLPLAAAVKLAIWPTDTVRFVGCKVIDGANPELTVAVVVAGAEAQPFTVTVTA